MADFVPPLAQFAKPYVSLSNSRITYRTYDPEGEVEQEFAVTLRKLIEEKDEHGLLLWGILTQMATMNMMLDAAAQRAQQPPDMSKIMEMVRGALPGAAAGVDLKRPE